jgi:hypothetical protein
MEKPARFRTVTFIEGADDEEEGYEAGADTDNGADGTKKHLPPFARCLDHCGLQRSCRTGISTCV